MKGFTYLDTSVMVVYLLGLVAIGGYFARRQKDVHDFFLAGRRFGWLPIALSVIATDLSANSYMGCPSIAFQKNLLYAMGIFMLPIAAVIAMLVVLRMFYRLKVYTIYEYLERRYNFWLRVLASLLFILQRGGWLASVIYVPSLALSVVTGMDKNLCILCMGVFATFYTAMGGIQGVIWCDVVQFCVLAGGIVVALGWILWDFGGNAAQIWAIASEQGKTRMFDFDLSLTTEYTFWAIAISGLVMYVSSCGVDQVTVQRYLTARSTRVVVKSVLGQSIITLPVILGLYAIGTGLVAYYTKHPDMMTALLAFDPSNPVAAMDRVFPHFIMCALPAGISGFVIAGILAATMSSVDSGINSLTTVIVMDFYKRFFHQDWKGPAHYLKAGRVGTVCVGALATAAAFSVGQIGTIIEITLTIGGMLVGPMVSMFFLGVLSKRVNAPGVFLGTLAGLGAVLVVSQTSRVHLLWYSPIGLVVSAVCGHVFSLFWPPPTQAQLATRTETPGLGDGE